MAVQTVRIINQTVVAPVFQGINYLIKHTVANLPTYFNLEFVKQIVIQDISINLFYAPVFKIPFILRMLRWMFIMSKPKY